MHAGAESASPPAPGVGEAGLFRVESVREASRKSPSEGPGRSLSGLHQQASLTPIQPSPSPSPPPGRWPLLSQRPSVPLSCFLFLRCSSLSLSLLLLLACSFPRPLKPAQRLPFPHPLCSGGPLSHSGPCTHIRRSCLQSGGSPQAQLRVNSSSAARDPMGVR